jgi:hypothetical protein
MIDQAALTVIGSLGVGTLALLGAVTLVSFFQRGAPEKQRCPNPGNGPSRHG